MWATILREYASNVPSSVAAGGSIVDSSGVKIEVEYEENWGGKDRPRRGVTRELQAGCYCPVESLGQASP